jgi:hypothetical protein
VNEDDVRTALVRLLNDEVPVANGHEIWTYKDALLDVAAELGVKL